MSPAGWCIRFAIGWCAATAGGSVLTYGLQTVIDGHASFEKHLGNWSVISAGALVLVFGLGMLVRVLTDDADAVRKARR